MIIEANKKTALAFTLIELMVCIVVVGVLAMLILPAMVQSSPPGPRYRINCISNLKQVDLGFLLWAGDNDNKFPQYYAGSANYPHINNPTAGIGGGTGGPWPAVETTCPNLFTVFFAMSNELSNPKIIICPEDKDRVKPTNFYDDFALNSVDGKNSKVSYFVGKDADYEHPQMMLAGDRNISRTHLINGARG